MRDISEIRREMDAAQEDLAARVADLRHVFEHKLEPLEKARAAKDRAAEFVRAYPLPSAFGALLVGFAIGWFRSG